VSRQLRKPAPFALSLPFGANRVLNEGIHKNPGSAVPLLHYRTGMFWETFALRSSLPTLNSD